MDAAAARAGRRRRAAAPSRRRPASAATTITSASDAAQTTSRWSVERRPRAIGRPTSSRRGGRRRRRGPGTMKPCSFRLRSIEATTMRTSGWSAWTCSMPSGAAMSAISVIELRAGLLDVVDRGGGRVAGREHRVEHDHVALGEVGRELDVVLDRLERLLVAVEADEADARARDQREDAVEHPHPGAQHRADGDLLAGDRARRSSARAASRPRPLGRGSPSSPRR